MKDYICITILAACIVASCAVPTETTPHDAQAIVIGVDARWADAGPPLDSHCEAICSYQDFACTPFDYASCYSGCWRQWIASPTACRSRLSEVNRLKGRNIWTCASGHPEPVSVTYQWEIDDAWYLYWLCAGGGDEEANLITPGCDSPTGDDDRVCEGGPGSGGPTIPGHQGPTNPPLTLRDICNLGRDPACCQPGVLVPPPGWCP